MTQTNIQQKLAEEFWIKKLAPEIPDWNFFKKQGIPSLEHDSFQEFDLPEEALHQIKNQFAKSDIAFFTFALSVLKVLLYRYSNQTDLAVLTPAFALNGKAAPENKILIRSNLNECITFLDVLKCVKEEVLAAYKHQDYSFSDLETKLNLESVRTFYNLGFVLEGLQLPFQLHATCDVLFRLQTTNKLSISYSSEKFEPKTIELLGGYFCQLMKLVASDLNQEIDELEFLSEAETQLLIETFNQTTTNFPKEKTLATLFEEIAAKHPERIALEFGKKQLTYAELNTKANQLAHVLLAKNTGPNSSVALVANRSMELIIGMLGILKAGGTYIPIDPDFPKQRIDFILKDSAAKLIVTQEIHRHLFADSFESLDLDSILAHSETPENPQTTTKPEDLAYIIYTSGSTGIPKGSQANQFNVSRVVKNSNYIELTPDDVVLQLSNVAFDGSVFDIFGALLNGAKLLLLEKEQLLNIEQLCRDIEQRKVSVMFITTALFNTLIDTNPSSLKTVRKILFGGERVSVKHVEKALDELGKEVLIHVYGPTESTVFATYYPINQLDASELTIPIGKALANTEVFVLNQDLKLQPLGSNGELCLGGDGLSAGYLNNPELTAEKFVDHPFQKGKKIYRTGDLVRMRPDGNIEFMDRMDQQVKIRGFRIELGEIEYRLLQFQKVREAKVLDLTDESGTKFLCAYLTLNQEIENDFLKTELAKELPDYMIPLHFVRLEQLPLNSSGKVDRKNLPYPKNQLANQFVKASTASEINLLKVWTEVLNLHGNEAQIGVRDNFFESGGHSLKASVLLFKIKKQFGVKIAMADFFEKPYIQDLAKLIDSQAKVAENEINPAEKQAFYPLSPAQLRMFVLDQFEGAGTTYNIPAFFEIQGKLDSDRVQQCFQKLVERHESFRTSFFQQDGNPVQQIHPPKDINFQVEIIATESNNVEHQIQDFVHQFDLSKAPLLRVSLLKLSPEKHILLTDMHHIVSDGVSMSILFDEFVNLYHGVDLPELRIQYKDYAVWQQKNNSNEIGVEKEQFWLEQFGSGLATDQIPVLNLPLDFKRPALQQFEGDHVEFELDPELTLALKKMTTENGTTLFMTLLAVYNILLSKYAAQEDIVIGTPTAGRSHDDLQQVIGMFVNTLALRNYPNQEKTFLGFLSEVRKRTLAAFDHDDYPFENLVELLNIKRDLSRNPLFDTLFTLQNIDFKTHELADLSFKPLSSDNKISKFDLFLEASESSDRIRFRMSYATALFRKERIERMGRHFTQLVKEITLNPEIQLLDLKTISPSKEAQILQQFNAEIHPIPSSESIVSLFEKQAKLHPEAKAVVFENQTLTYTELNQKANQVAHKLLECGLKQEELVAIIAERSAETIVGILGILKAGGAYLPIEASYPQERIDYFIADSNTRFCLVQQETNVKQDVIAINLLDETLNEFGNENPNPLNSANSLAYLLYTSGSTGNPKGVLIEHKSVIRLVKNTNYIDIKPTDRIFQTGAINFDASTFEIWGALLNGASLYLAKQQDLLNATALKQVLHNHQITTCWFTSSFFNQLVESDLEIFAPLHTLLVGGDRLSPYHIEKIRKAYPALTVINGYGPTENTTFTTCFEITESYAEIPIGRPIANTQVYVLNEQQHLQAIGIPGELCIGGLGLARGYLNDEELSAQKFVANPFRSGEKMYRTGDLAMWNSEGVLEFLGRNDHQVKIRGFRIEMGEIENQLLKHPSIDSVAVIDRVHESGEKYLSAYYVSENIVSDSDLKSHLSERLPNYMVPSSFVSLDVIPLTSNGKTDRSALPEPSQLILSAKKTAFPVTETELQLANIWKEVLGLSLEFQQIDVETSFFDLGGHSLKAMQLAHRIHRHFQVELSLTTLFNKSTIREQAVFIERQEQRVQFRIPKAPDQNHYPLSAPQKRMYILNQLSEGNVSYNMPGFLNLEGKLDLEKFKKAFEQLQVRHESLRTSFQVVDGEVVQSVQAPCGFNPEELNAEHLHPDHVKEFIDRFVRPFDLSQGHLIRIGLITFSQEKHLLLFDMHHIISDGQSMAVLMDEFSQLYAGIQLPEPQLHYKDFAYWQNEQSSLVSFTKKETFWLNQFTDESGNTDVPILNLLTDFSRPPVQQFEGANHHFLLNEQQTKALRKMAAENKTSLFMLLLSNYYVLLSSYCRQDDLVVGSPVSGRMFPELESSIGMFVNTLALRNRVDQTKSFLEFVQQVSKNTLHAFEHQDYPLENLIEAVNINRDLSRNPLFDTIFTLQNKQTNATTASNSELKISPYEVESKTAKFDLTVEAIELEQEIYINISYATHLFKAESMALFAEHFEFLIQQTLEMPDASIGSISLYSNSQETFFESINSTTTDFPKSKTLVELFEEQVHLNPKKIALTFDQEELSYLELNEKANQLAQRIRQHTSQNGTAIALLLDRSFNQIISILAVLKSGGIYVPIDPKYPQERIQFMLEDSASTLVITQSEYEQLVENTETLNLSKLDLNTFPSDNLLLELQASDTAYIMYTSGSTGRAKGTLIAHYNISRIALNTNFIEINPDDVLLQLSNYTFDGSVFDIYGALLNGAKLVLIDSKQVLNPSVLHQTILAKKVSISFITTSLFNALVDTQIETLKPLRKILIGGERASIKHLKKALEILGSTRLINGYGPTESTFFATYHPVNELEVGIVNIPIGRPISNTKVCVLDAQNKLVPAGIPGELALFGDGLSSGYLNNEALTLEKFIPHPTLQNTRIYKTGDLVKVLPNGDIEFIDRMDQQVKIRGYRIEMQEIELAIGKIADVLEVLVVTIDDGNQKALCAYFVAEKPISPDEIKSQLGEKMPEYMIPMYVIQLEKFPLNSSGKIDRKQLPAPLEQLESAVGYLAPFTEIERKLLELWQEILNIPTENQIGTLHNFFELGGHSLKAITLLSQIHKQFHSKLSLSELFRNTTIQSQAKLIEGSVSEEHQSIAKIQKAPAYELSPAQRRLWVLDQLQGGSTEYNMPTLLSFDEQIDSSGLKTALKQLVQRHEMLRTNFIQLDGVPFQIVHDQPQLVFFELEASDVETIEKIYTTEALHPFNLEKDPLLRVTLVQIQNHCKLIVVMHHIISDGISMDVFQRDLIELYRAEKLQQPPELPELSIQYKDYAAWQNKQLNEGEIQKLKRFWHETLAGDLPHLEFPRDQVRETPIQNLGSRYYLHLNETQLQQVNELSAQTNSSLFMILLSVFTVLLQRVCDSKDVLVGTPVAGRQHDDLKNLIGFFLNTVMLRNQVDPELSFLEFLQRVKTNTLSALEHQDYPFELLVDELEPEPSRTSADVNNFPFTSIFFNMPDMEDAAQSILEDFTPFHQHHNRKTKFDLNVYLIKYKNGIRIECEYKNESIDPQSIELFFSKFMSILQQATYKPNCRLKDLQTQHVIPTNEKSEDSDWYGKSENIIDQFNHIVRLYPDQPAIVSLTTQWSYTQLDQLSNQFARQIQTQNQKVKQTIAILCSQNERMALAVLGILKSGQSYLPLDPDYPVERIQFILNDAKPDLLVCDLNNKELALKLLNESEINLLCIDEAPYQLESREALNLEIQTTQHAYLLYTSGSTGTPKGMYQSHGAVLHFISTYTAALKIQAEDRMTGFSSISFDSFVNDFYGALLNGACYHPLSLKSDVSIDQLPAWIRKNNISILHCVPTVLRHLYTASAARKFESLRLVKMTGEATRKSDFEVFKNLTNENASFVVSYGATENTLTCIHILQHKSSIQTALIPAGIPVSRTEIRIINAANTCCDVLEPGEIFVHSPFMTTGYLNNEGLNQNLFLELEGKIHYRSGDIGRILKNGMLEIIGRRDNQVKLRGMRIELAEIENHLLQIEGIDQAVVVIQGQDDQAKLIAFLTGKTQNSVNELRNQLTRFLPGYMIPESFVQLDQFPLTPSGKINRMALSGLQGEELESGIEFIAARTEMERQLEQIWKEVLENPTLETQAIGIKESFFRLGGHSLKASILLSRIHRQFQVELSLKQIFNHPTIEGLSECISRSEQSLFKSIQASEKRENYPLSPAQQRMFILNRLDAKATTYNMPGAIRIIGKINPIRFEQAFKSLLIRHESLRTGFIIENGIPLQFIVDENDTQIQDFTIKFMESKENSSDDAWIDTAVSNFVRPFDLSIAPLFRVALLKISDEEQLLMFDLHHIISDGISKSILVHEFAKLYDGQSLPELQLNYRDYALWQNDLLQQGTLGKQEQFWLNTFADELPVLELPTDFKRPEIKTFQGSNFKFSLNQEQYRQLHLFSNEREATHYQVLLAVYFVFLSKYTRQQDLVVGTPISGRNHPDLQPLVGMFVNTLALRNNLNPHASFDEILKQISENYLMAFEHQLYQFEELVDQVVSKRDLSRNPLFDTVFSLQKIEPQEISLSGLEFVPFESKNETSKFDLSLHAVESAAHISFNFEYDTNLFKAESIERMGMHFVQLMEEITLNPTCQLADFKIISNEEEAYVLNQFNPEITPHPIDESIVSHFEEHVKLHPDKTAVVFENQSLSYSELNQKANRVACELRIAGLQQEELVAIIAERSLETIVGLLGILKAGGAYLPIEATYPQERIDYFIQDSNARICLVQHKTSQVLIQTISLIDEKLDQNSSENLKPLNSSASLAYLIYTSGSTGIPKGVLIEHKSVIRLVKNANYINIQPKDRIFQTGAINFDASTFEIWGALLNGASLYLAKQEDLLTGSSIKNLFHLHHISICFLTTSFFNQLVESEPEIFAPLEKLLVGGDRLSTYHISKIRKRHPNLNIMNVYGPTENTTFTTYFEIADSEFDVEIPIGRPISNTSVYILDERQQLQAIGVYGELCIGGVGLARGYLNAPELNAQKFIENPFRRGEKMYRSGDLARWNSDGNLEFFGRMDQQVKIRGYRIELGEIETAMLKHEHIQEAVVVAKKDPQQNSYLQAYLVSPEKEITVQELRTHLSQNLPDYMIPSHFVSLEKIPLTSNGKVDRKALPEADGSIQSGTEYVAPRNETEQQLVEIWQEILGIDRIGVLDNFFELGGQSMKVILFISRVQEQFTVEIPFKVVFENPRIEELAAYLKTAQNLDLSSIDEFGVLLNEKQEQHLFFFPAGIGYGLMYTELAKEFKTHSFYAMNFIENEDRMDLYINYIKEIQAEGPYALGGYSAGGNLAFRVAVELEKRGELVSDLILLDVSYRTEPLNLTNDELKSRVKTLLYGPDGTAENSMLTNTSIRNKAERKIEAYLNYIYTQCDEGKIHAAIHLIKSEEQVLENQRDRRMEWQHASHHLFNIYPGKGLHGEMLDEEFISKNAYLISEILNTK